MSADRSQSQSHVPRPPVAVLGVAFDPVTMPEAVERIEQMIASRRPHYVVTANVDFIVQAQKDLELHRTLLDAHLVLCDGTPLVWASRLLGNALPERVAGADLVPQLIRLAADKGYRLFFLGATEESANQAMENLRRQFPRLHVDSYSPRFKPLLEMDHDEIDRRIRSAQPDILLVSLGCPKQEKWMAMHYRSLGVPVTIGVGATVDFLAGRVKRAPRWMQRSGTEWIFRLLQEPRRLFGRYAKDLWGFGWRIVAQWWQLGAQRRSSADSRHETMNEFSADPLSARIPSEQTAGDYWQCVALPERLDLEAVRALAFITEDDSGEDSDCLLDMARVRFVDSSGIAWLIHLEKRLRSSGRRLVLLAPGPSVQRALSRMRLRPFFVQAGDVATAQQWREAAISETARPVIVRSLLDGPSLCWRGEITAANADRVWAATQPLIRAAPGEMFIDLAGVRFMDSSGAGIMRRARMLADRRRMKLVFYHPPEAVQDVLRYSRLDTLLAESVPDEPVRLSTQDGLLASQHS